MGTQIDPPSQAGEAPGDLVGQAPVLSLVQHTQANIPLYPAAASTPVARQQCFKDRQLAVLQQRLESSMHLLIAAVDKPDSQVQYLHTAAAFCPSGMYNKHVGPLSLVRAHIGLNHAQMTMRHDCSAERRTLCLAICPSLRIVEASNSAITNRTPPQQNGSGYQLQGQKGNRYRGRSRSRAPENKKGRNKS